MKNSVIFLITVIFILGLIIGCAKKVEKENADYIGGWAGFDGVFDYSLVIDNNSNGTWTKVGLATTTVSGKARIKNNGKLKIGVKGFVVSQNPTEIIDTSIFADTYWTMILDGVTYIGK